MTNEHETPQYEPPMLEVVGSLHDITKQGSKPNADLKGGKANTAFSVP